MTALPVKHIAVQQLRIFVCVFAVAPAGLFVLGRHPHGLAMGWLVAASLFFCGWWYPSDLALLLSSAVCCSGASEFIYFQS